METTSVNGVDGIIGEFRKGATLKELAIKHKCPPGVISQLLRLAGLDEDLELRQLETAQKYADLLRSGTGYAEIAKAFDVAESSIKAAVAKLGVEVKTERAIQKEKRDEQIAALNKEGLTQSAIAEKVGVNVQTVAAVLQRRGLAPNRIRGARLGGEARCSTQARRPWRRLRSSKSPRISCIPWARSASALTPARGWRLSRFSLRAAF